MLHQIDQPTTPSVIHATPWIDGVPWIDGTPWIDSQWLATMIDMPAPAQIHGGVYRWWRWQFAEVEGRDTTLQLAANINQAPFAISRSPMPLIGDES